MEASEFSSLRGIDDRIGVCGGLHLVIPCASQAMHLNRMGERTLTKSLSFVVADMGPRLTDGRFEEEEPSDENDYTFHRLLSFGLAGCGESERVIREIVGAGRLALLLGWEASDEQSAATSEIDEIPEHEQLPHFRFSLGLGHRTDRHLGHLRGGFPHRGTQSCLH